VCPDKLTQLTEVVLNDAGIIRLGQLALQLRSEFNRKSGMSIKESCYPILS